MGMMSNQYDYVNKIVLDRQIDEFIAHLKVAKENFRQKMVTIFH